MNIHSLLSLAQSDPGLASDERSQLVNMLQDKNVEKFISGAAGATLSVVAAKYMKLGRTSQILLGVAGFGLGRFLFDHLTEQKHRFATYDPHMRTNHIDSNRY